MEIKKKCHTCGKEVKDDYFRRETQTIVNGKMIEEIKYFCSDDCQYEDIFGDDDYYDWNQEDK